MTIQDTQASVTAREAIEEVSEFPWQLQEQPLAAVLVIDLAGFSSSMRADAEGTINDWLKARYVFEKIITSENGSIFSRPGDALFAHFSSCSRAVSAAMRLRRSQIQIGTHPVGNRVRIGITIGTVYLIDRGDLLGDTVNRASRIQSEAKSGQIIVDYAVKNDLVSKNIGVKFHYVGRRTLKNISKREPLWILGDKENYNVSTFMSTNLKYAVKRHSTAAVTILCALLLAASLTLNSSVEFHRKAATEANERLSSFLIYAHYQIAYVKKVYDGGQQSESFQFSHWRPQVMKADRGRESQYATTLYIGRLVEITNLLTTDASITFLRKSPSEITVSFDVAPLTPTDADIYIFDRNIKDKVLDYCKLSEGGVSRLKGDNIRYCWELLLRYTRFSLILTKGGRVIYRADMDIGRDEHTMIRDVFKPL